MNRLQKIAAAKDAKKTTNEIFAAKLAAAKETGIIDYLGAAELAKAEQKELRGNAAMRPNRS